MKRTLLFIACVLASLIMSAQAYFPEGTKWTEIRLDTLKYDSWYSKVGEEWVPNFETIEYYVKGEFIDKSRGDGKDKYRCVYTNGPEWTDSLTLLLQEEGDAEYVGYNSVMVSVLPHDDDGSSRPLWPGEAYQFDWSIGKGLFFKDILLSNTTSLLQSYYYYGIIDEIKEGNFGGVRPLKYVDLDGKAPENDPNSPIRNASTQGGRILQGIGITEWNDGECLFGPPNPYFALRMFDSYPEEKYPQRHYRSMLVHFERNGEVLYDVWSDILPQNVYDSMLSESKVWTLNYKPVVDPNLHSDTYYIEELKLVGDTVMDGIHFGQIYNRECRNDKTMPEEWHATDKYIGQDGGKVYQYFRSAKKMRLDMDFSLQVGDKFGCKFFSSPNDTVLTFVVTAVYDTILESSTDRKSRKCIHIQSESYPELSDVWIEGIGSLEYGLLGFTYYFQWVGSIPRMAKCTDGNAVLYQTGNQKVNDYRPLLAEGKVWTYRYNNGVRQYMKSLTIGGDTIIGNQTYKKIIDVASQAVEMSLREEDKKVYCCYPSRDTEILLYDFSKNAGEIISKEIKNGDTYIQKVTSVDNIMVNDKVFRCMTVHEYVIPEGMSEEEYFAGNYGYESGFWIEGIGSFAYLSSPIPYDGNYYSFYECQIGDMIFKQKDFLDAIKNDTQPAYRPFVEDSKVWKVGAITSGNPVQLVEYYYFDGDTIIDGKTCKQMMCQRYVTPDFAESNFISQDPPLCYVGAWYEEDKKVYEYDTKSKQFKMMYDFSIDANDTLQIGHYSYVIGPRTTGGIKGFKGVYREVRECREVWDCGDGVISFRCAPWLEGVGIVYGPPTTNVFNVELADPMWFLMSCTVGDEVIYLDDAVEDGATPAGARKRFDFTHTTKPKPKARNRSGAEAEQPLYGEYNDLQLGINLDPLSDAYLVRITDESDKVVYEKTVNAGNIVALNIDISAYAKGRYTVIVENSQETFTGEFETLTSGIRDVRCKKEDGRSIIYNLQGQRLHSLQKGLNIVNGQKVFVK